eukprot:Gregarina_sp_Poly_1__522@NODE_1126_length_5010_cov_45_168521_g690_i2_p2_GENE_NODE_1126_length_5010_cov_45_168521_g690_i2NODE_1126_length_5010_cov_45_168521_g690_i2_p2_ORF_typecomplete_len187_score17_77_NODE_1126_length_5010_cov_45_168521_g690_i234303990
MWIISSCRRQFGDYGWEEKIFSVEENFFTMPRSVQITEATDFSGWQWMPLVAMPLVIGVSPDDGTVVIESSSLQGGNAFSFSENRYRHEFPQLLIEAGFARDVYFLSRGRTTSKLTGQTRALGLKTFLERYKGVKVCRENLAEKKLQENLAHLRQHPALDIRRLLELFECGFKLTAEVGHEVKNYF